MADCTKLRIAARGPSSRNTTPPTTSAYIAAKEEISVAVAKPDLKPPKMITISPSVTAAPPHNFPIGVFAR